MGNEAFYTYQDDLPAGSSVPGPYGGVLPIGNVHPNQLGYTQIAADVLAMPVPEPASWALLLPGLGALGMAARWRSKGTAVPTSLRFSLPSTGPRT